MKRRVDQPELLDLGDGTVQDARQSLRDLEHINRYLGGVAALTAHLYPRLRRERTPITLVDIGTGSAETPRVICAWAAARGLDVRAYALDFSARNLDFAHRSERVRLIQGDGLNLPFAADRVDYFVSSLFMHHLPPDNVIAFLRDTYRLARRGIVMSDLVRGRLALIGFKLAQPIFARSYITRYDGEVSVRRAYTPLEMLDMAREAGLPHARVHLHPLFRMTLVADKC